MTEREAIWIKQGSIVPGKWRVSPHNFCNDVRKHMPNLPKKVCIRDITFREADDMLGYEMALENKVKLALFDAEIGIGEIDIGGPTILPSQLVQLKAIRKAFNEHGIDKNTLRIQGRYFGEARKDHKSLCDVILQGGADEVRCRINSYGPYGSKEWEASVAMCAEAVDYVHDEYGAKMIVGFGTANDTIEDMRGAFKDIKEMGADRAWISDTHSTAIPAAGRYLVSEVRKILGPDIPLQTHCHNSHGMGTAVTLAYVEGGADEPGVTWNGFGDLPGGNTCLEEVVVNLEAMYGVKTGVDLERLVEGSEMVEKWSGVETQPNKAYTGRPRHFTPRSAVSWGDEAGMALSDIPNPEQVLAERAKLSPKTGPGVNQVTVFGKKEMACWSPYKLAPKAVAIFLERNGYKATDDNVEKAMELALAECARQVQTNRELMAKKQKGYLTNEEFQNLVRGKIS